MVDLADNYFSDNYFSARRKFIELAKEKGFPLKSYIHPHSKGANQQLATDVVTIGNPKASRIIIVNSGTHGLEGLAGSGIQTGLLYNLTNNLPDDVGLCIIHALNPWGVDNKRRQNEDNVDLNRNFIDFTAPKPSNIYYDLLHEKISGPGVYIDGQKNPKFQENIDRFIKAYGETAYHTALFQGQYNHPTGVGFGGSSPSWSNKTFHKIMNEFCKSAQLVAAIDIHTGLGDYGQGIMINNSPEDSQASKFANTWYGTSLVNLAIDGALPYKTEGDTFSGFETAFPNTTVVAAALEFGTYSVDQLMTLQIEDVWLHHYGKNNSPHGINIKEKLQDFFYPKDKKWRCKIYKQAEKTIHNVIENISGHSA